MYELHGTLFLLILSLLFFVGIREVWVARYVDHPVCSQRPLLHFWCCYWYIRDACRNAKKRDFKAAKRIDGVGLNSILVPNVQKMLKECQEGWGYSPESLVRIQCSYHTSLHFGTKIGQIPKLLDSAPVWFWSLKWQYRHITMQLLSHLCDSATTSQSDVLKNRYFCISLENAGFGLNHLLILMGSFIVWECANYQYLPITLPPTSLAVA